MKKKKNVHLWTQDIFHQVSIFCQFSVYQTIFKCLIVNLFSLVQRMDAMFGGFPPPTTPPPVMSKVTETPSIIKEEEEEEEEEEESDEQFTLGRMERKLTREFPLLTNPIRMCDEDSLRQRPDFQNICTRIFPKGGPVAAVQNLALPLHPSAQFIRQDRCNRNGLNEVNNQITAISNQVRELVTQLLGLQISYDSALKAQARKLMCYITHEKATGFNHDLNKAKLRTKCNNARLSIRRSMEDVQLEITDRMQMLLNLRQQQVSYKIIKKYIIIKKVMILKGKFFYYSLQSKWDGDIYWIILTLDILLSISLPICL